MLVGLDLCASQLEEMLVVWVWLRSRPGGGLGSDDLWQFKLDLREFIYD